MKLRLKNLFSATYWRYVLSFSTLVLLVIAVMGAYLYNYYYNTIYSDFSKSNNAYLAAAANSHEKGIELISNISIQLDISNSVIPFRLFEHSEKTISLENQIKIYKVVSQFYKQMFLMFNIDDYLYNDSTSVRIDRFLNTGLLLENDSSDTLYRLLRHPGIITVLKEQNISGNLFVESGSAVLYALTIQSKGTLLFIVNRSYYDTLLNTSPDDLRSSYILHDESVIVSRGNLPLENQTIEKMLADKNAGQFEYQDKNGKYLFTVTVGTYGFKYCTVQSMRVFQNKVYNGQWGLLFYIVLLTIPCAIIIVFLSKRLYKPLHTIRSMFRQNGIGNDFDVIQKGINELVGHNQELNELMEQNLPVRQAEVIRNFVRGTYVNRNIFLEHARNVNLSLDKKYFAVILTGSAYHMSEVPVTESLLKLLKSDKQVTGYGCELIHSNQTLYVFFADSKGAISNFTNRFVDMGRGLCESFVVSMSRIQDDFSHISAAYLEANTAYDNRFLVGEGDILHFEDIATSQNTAPLPQMYVESLKNALRLGDEQAMDSVIDDIFHHLRSVKQSLFTFRVLYNDIISVLLREAEQEHINIPHLYDVFTLSRCLSIQDLDCMLRSVCRALLHNPKNAKENVEVKMQEAISYMQENYSDSNLNMNALAEHLSISTVTLSIEFKEFIGMSPSDYLTLLRIEKAKKLLRESTLSIKEICSAVGYYDVPNFTRRFKKYTAQTPVQFRQEYLNSL